MALLSEEQQALVKMVQEFASKEIAPHAAEYDHAEKFPWENVHKLAELGLMGLPIPEQYGGADVNTLSYIAVVEEISKACAATGAILAVHTSAGIMQFSCLVQKSRNKSIYRIWLVVRK